MNDQIYCDGVEDVYYVGGVVRVDLFSYSPTERDDKGHPVPNFRQQLVMSPRAFAQSYMMLERMMRTLSERGLVEAPVPPASTGK